MPMNRRYDKPEHMIRRCSCSFCILLCILGSCSDGSHGYIASGGVCGYISKFSSRDTALSKRFGKCCITVSEYRREKQSLSCFLSGKPCAHPHVASLIPKWNGVGRHSRSSILASAIESVPSSAPSRRLYLQDVVSRVSSSNNYISTQEAEVLDKALVVLDNVVGSSKLLGVPVAIKDNICVKGLPTTAGSQMLAQYTSSYDATVVARLKNAGALIIGKTNMDDFAMGSSTQTSRYKSTTNPSDVSRSAGGSSGGSAATVAAGEVPAALGSDSGGSIRHPAAWCGCVGLKPTYGRVSRHGLLAYSSTSDTVGPLARNVQDAATLLEVIAGQDDKDYTTLADPVPRFGTLLKEFSHKADWNKPLKSWRVGYLTNVTQSGTSVETDVLKRFREFLEVLEGLGATLLAVTIPDLAACCSAYHIQAMSEASSNMARYDGIRYGSALGRKFGENLAYYRKQHLGDEVRIRLLLGGLFLGGQSHGDYLMKASVVITTLRRRLQEIFETVDVLVTPTCATTARRVDAANISPEDVYMADIFLVPASLGGLPALSVPCGISTTGLPIGVQLIGPLMDELAILKAGLAYEAAVEKGNASCR